MTEHISTIKSDFFKVISMPLLLDEEISYVSLAVTIPKVLERTTCTLFIKK
jgi:hypothetical protein